MARRAKSLSQSLASLKANLIAGGFHGLMAEMEATPQRSRIAAARERTDKAKTALLAAALIAFFVTMGFERGAHHRSTSGTSQTSVTSESSDDGSGFFFDNGGLSPSQGTPPTSTNTS